MINNHRILLAPDIIKESNGVACGDMLSLSAYRENTKLFFRFNGEACDVALEVADYLETTYSGHEELAIKCNLERLMERQYNDVEQWMMNYIINRRECVESPIRLLYGVIGETTACEIDIRDKAILACDACVSTKPINWKPNRGEKDELNIREIAKKLNALDDPTEIKFQKMGLCVLTNENQKCFEKSFERITEMEFNLIKRLRLPVLLYNNARKYDICIDKRIEELAIKQIVSLCVANEEIKIVNEFINKNKLRIDAVKGGKTNQYYPPNYSRTHMDFDYLAAKFEDAFEFISFLINVRKFKLVIGGSVPFSLKSVLNMKGEEILIGHIHLEKILQDNYQVVVDVNIGGFPLGRTGIIQCNNETKISLEELICITVAHLFKHEFAFMKDINDLFYLLSAVELDKEKLVELLQRFELVNLFSVVYKFLIDNMGLDVEIPCESNMNISPKRIETWPFSRKSHFYIKAKDMLSLNCKQYGEIEGRRETLNQICGKIGEIPAIKYSGLVKRMNERIYLYPVTIFNKYLNLMPQRELQVIEKNIWRYHQLLILPIGIFLIQDVSGTEVSREQLNDEICKLFSMLGLEEYVCNTSYVMEARRDIWLY